MDLSGFTTLSLRLRGESRGRAPFVYMDDGNWRWIVNLGDFGSITDEWQTFEIPLSSFISAQPDFVPVDLAGINLVFDRGDKGVVIVDRIGFAQR